VSGLGFGVMSGAFSLVNVLADMTGPGTVGILGQSSQFFITSGAWHLSYSMSVWWVTSCQENLEMSWNLTSLKEVEKLTKSGNCHGEILSWKTATVNFTFGQC